jgi:hypothetical protein
VPCVFGSSAARDRHDKRSQPSRATPLYLNHRGDDRFSSIPSSAKIYVVENLQSFGCYGCQDLINPLAEDTELLRYIGGVVENFMSILALICRSWGRRTLYMRILKITGRT